MKRMPHRETGSTLVVTIVVVATLLALLGAAVDYSTQISRQTQRSRATAQAMEIADGHLEALYTNWRNIYRSSWMTYGYNTGGTNLAYTAGTNYFATTIYTPSTVATPLPFMNPAVTPPVIPTPAPSNFSTTNYTLSQYRIQAVDPMIDVDVNNNENALVESGAKGNGNLVPMPVNSPPPGAYGPNPMTVYGVTVYYPYSFYYLAAADVQVPTLTTNVTAKVRRVFEKKFDLPWRYMMFYVDDLELQPSASLSITGPIHTNNSLYIGTSNVSTNSRVEYSADYVNGYSPYDPRYPATGSAPSFAKSDPSLALSDCPPYQVAPYVPFGWNLTLNSSGVSVNDDGYREIIERPSSGTDPLAGVRMYNQAGLAIIINSTNTAANVNTITAVYPTVSPSPAATPTNSVMNTINGIVSTGSSSSSTLASSYAFYDNRETAYVKAINVDVYQLAKAVNANSIPNWNGVLYISDAGATTYNVDGTVRTAGTSTSVTCNGVTASTTKRCIRLINAGILPTGGLTIATDNPVYIVGDYNVNPNGSTSGSSAPASAPTPPSDVTTYTSPTVSGTQKYAAIYCDAITLLSKNWTDNNSTGNVTPQSRWGYNTTVNTCVVAGNTASSTGVYGGGGENFFRFLEDWGHNNNTFTYYGSMVQLYRPQQGIGAWSGSGNTYKAPALKWYYDSTLLTAGTPPGNMDIAAYLQQQRWYQVY